MLDDTNGKSDIFVYDSNTGEIQIVSLGKFRLPADGPSFAPIISGDGRYVAFLSDASNLVDGYANSKTGAFIVDLRTGITSLLSVLPGEIKNSGNAVGSLAISADGSKVAFVAEDETDGSTSLYVRDLLLGITLPVPIVDQPLFVDPSSGALLMNGSFTSSFDRVAFVSSRPDLVANDTNGVDDIFVFDFSSGTVIRASVGSNQQQADGRSEQPFLSGDGSTVAFISYSNNLYEQDLGVGPDVMVRDLGSNTTLNITVPVSNAYPPHRPSLSNDGKFLSVRAYTGGDSPWAATVIQYINVETNQSSVVSLETVVPSTDANRMIYPVLSGDGLKVVYTKFVRSNTAIRESFIWDSQLSIGADNRFLEGTRSVVNLPVRLAPGSISGRVFQDVIRNDQFDLGEPGVGQVVVFLDANKNGLLDSNEVRQLTDANGSYRFQGLAPLQEYSIGIVVPPSLQQTFPSNNASWRVFLGAGAQLEDRDFAVVQSTAGGQFENASISGTLFHDLNEDGIRQVGERAISGVTVYLDLNGNAVRDFNEPRVVTDSQGNYSFAGLGNRVYTVRTLLDSETEQTSPLGAKFETDTYRLTSGSAQLANAQDVLVADFNGDGYPDLAVAMFAGNHVSIRLNDGKGGFSATPVQVPVAPQGFGPIALAVGDLNGNSMIDLVSANQLNGTVTVMLDFDGQDFASMVTIPVGDSPTDIALGDFDQDGDVDFVVVNQQTNQLALFINDGSGRFSPGGVFSTGGQRPTSVVTGHFNEDPYLDVAITNFGTHPRGGDFGNVSVLMGRSDASFDAAVPYSVGIGPISIAVADVNGDGVQDLVSANFLSNTASVLLGTRSGFFDASGQSLSTGQGPLQVSTVDIDNDQDVDIVVTNLLSQSVSILRNRHNQGGAGFEPAESFGVGQFVAANRLAFAVGDFDLSGVSDLAIVNSLDDSLKILSNRLVDGAHRVQLSGVEALSNLDFGIRPVKLPPSFAVIANPAPILEDAAQQTIPINGITKGRTTGPQLQFTVTSSNPALIASPMVTYTAGSHATVSYTPLSDRNGEAIITIRAVDAGADTQFGTDDDGIFERSFTVSVLAVNDPPVFTIPTGVMVTQKAGPQAFASFVTGLGPGGAVDEASQNLSAFTVAADNSFFVTPPAIDASGQLTFNPSPNNSGVVPVTVTVSDNGGRANGGVDTMTKTFVINILPVNDPPTINLAGNQSVRADVGLRNVTNFANGFQPGGGEDEALQEISDFIVTVDSPGLFSVLPSISVNGTLTYAPAIDRTGTATVSVQVRDSGGRANGGNDLSAVQTFTITVTPIPDTTRPTPVITPSVPALTNQASFPVDVDFGEPVDGFTLANITVSAGTMSELENLGDGKFRFMYTGSDGSVTFNIAENINSDLAGNPNFAAVPVTRTIDTVGVTAILDSPVANPTNATSFTATIEFGEPVVGFTLSDLTVLNGSTTNLNPVNAATGSYSVTITPTSDGTVTVLLPAGVVTDPAGNVNRVADPLIRTIDHTRPTVKLSSNEPAITNRTSFDVFAQFSEPVTTLTTAGVSITGGTAGTPVLVSPGLYRIPITATVGEVRLRVVEAAVSDPAGNTSQASGEYTITVDPAVVFTPALSSTSAAELNMTTFVASVNFGSQVSGFSVDKIVVVNGTASGLTPVNVANGLYTFTVAADRDGQVGVVIPTDVASNAVGNPNGASNVLIRTIDRVAPQARMSVNVPTLTNQANFVLTVEFGEVVTGFELNDVVASGATLSALQHLGGGRYTMNVTATHGPVTFNLPAGIANDLAGNANVAATPISLTVDTSSPLPTLTTMAPHLSNAGSFVVAANFDERVTGFELSDLLLINGGASDLVEVNQATGSYTFVVTPINDGVASVLIPAGAAADQAGNLSRASGLLSRSFDRTVPIPMLSTTEPSRTNKTTFDAIVNFGEPVTGLTRSDFAVTGATISDPLDLGGGRYAINITATADLVEVSLPAGAAVDNAGNPSSASNRLVRTIETTRVLPLLNASIPPISNVSSFVVSIDFTTQVFGFDPSSLFAVGGTMSEFAVVDQPTGRYSVRVTPTADGEVTLLLPANAATDSVGNGNLAAAPLVRTIDRVAPVITLSASQSSPTLETSFAVIVQSSEAITGLTASSFQVSGGTIGQPLPLGDGRYSVAVTATGGMFELSVRGGEVTDAAGNVNAASNVLRIEVTARSPILAPTLDGQSIDLTAIADADLVNIETIDLRGFGDNVLSLDSDKIRSLFANSSVTVYADPGDTILFDGDWRFERIELVGGEVHRVFTNSGATIRTIGPSDFTNPRNRFDVDGSGEVTALDALHVLTAIRAREIVDAQGGFLPLTAENQSSFQFVDVNQDNILTPLDALLVLIEMRRMLIAAEGPAGEQVIAPPPQQRNGLIASDDGWDDRDAEPLSTKNTQAKSASDFSRNDFVQKTETPQVPNHASDQTGEGSASASVDSFVLVDQAFADPELLDEKR